MNENDLLKKIESLERRLKSLEADKKGNESHFGRSYSQIGDTSSDFLIKTRGLVKIQWGSKFIDLIKDGKINVDNQSIIYLVQDESKIKSDGIYVTEEGKVILKVKNNLIELSSADDTYVSFMSELKTSAELKYTAMQNIGFIYKDIASIDETSIQNGIVYIESEHKLYLINEGKLSIFTLDFPEVINHPFTIEKSDTSLGSLIIKGSGSSNSIKFDHFYIYNDNNNTCFNSNKDIKFLINNTLSFLLGSNSALLKTPLIANNIQSENDGFRLYELNGKSTLEVDELIVRNGIDSNSSDNYDSIYPEEWFKDNNIIKNIKAIDLTNYKIELLYNNHYLAKDYLYTYYEQTKIPFIVTSIEPENIIYVKLDLDTPLSKLSEALKGQVIFLVGSEETPITVLKRSESIDLIKSSNFDDEKNLQSIQSRFGDLNELNLLEGVNTPIKGYGLFSKLAYFDRAAYTKGYKLSDNDNSATLATTEWVNKKLSQTVDIDLTINESLINGDYYPTYFARVLSLVDKLEDSTTMSYLCYNGILTITKTVLTVNYSAIVKAKTDNDTWSYRAIHAIYNSHTSKWTGKSTYIILDLFIPGYYWTTEFNGLPVSPEYIGTTNSLTVSESIPYIIYSNDGKTWKLIDKYVPIDSSLVYFAASGAAACSLPNAQAVPMGFIGIIKSDGTTLVNLGKSNYAIETFNVDNPVTGDVRGLIPKATRTLLINTLKDAKAGVIPSIAGLSTIFYINKSDIATIPENSIHRLKSSEEELSFDTIFLDARIKVRNRILSLCRWTNSVGVKYNTEFPGTYKSIGDIDFWRDDLNIRILAGAILCNIFKSVPNVSADKVRDTIYSDSVGFALSYVATHWENFDFFLMSGVCETSFAKPTDDDKNAKAGLKMDNSINIICDSTNIYGKFCVTYRDYKWPESPNVNYPYLSAMWAIDEATNIDEINRLPYPVDILLSLIFNGTYKIEGTVGNNLAITNI